jgi:small subunit ribosomal protein S2
MATVVSMKALLESGVHFGHRTNKWNPYMRPFIFTERNGIHIIDLQQTVKALNNAYNLVREAVTNGGTVMFVGTKRQAQETVKEEAIRAGMPYVTERWLGGMLTNWSTMFQRIQEMERLEHLRDSGEINRLTKKEGLLIEREIIRLSIRLSGVRMMNKLPDLIFIVDVAREETAVHEANLTGIPVIGLVDTNCDPRGVDYVIPSNDDAIRAIKLLVGKIADAVVEGKASRKEEFEEEPSAQAVVAPVAPDLHGRLDVDEDLEDKDLLGAATLAKLAPRHEVVLAATAPVVVEAAAVEEAETPEVETAEEAHAAAVEEETPEVKTAVEEEAPEVETAEVETAEVETVKEETSEVDPAEVETAAEEVEDIADEKE